MIRFATVRLASDVCAPPLGLSRSLSRARTATAWSLNKAQKNHDARKRRSFCPALAEVGQLRLETSFLDKVPLDV
jgi:hypothetical protein